MRKNILILGHSYATQFIDVYNQYTRLFDKNKYHVTIAYLTGKPNEHVLDRTIADEVLFLNAPKASIRGLKINQIKNALKLCKERQFEIVICHRYKPSYIMMWVAQFINIPALIFVMHELNTMKSINRRLLITALFRKNMMFAGVSNAVRDDIRKHIWRVPANRVETLYNVIDVELTKPQLHTREEARQQLNIPANTYVFGHVARLVPNKDQATLIQAFANIKEECPNAKLIILGNGVLESTLKEQVAALHLQDQVIFTGFVPEGFRFMRAFDCFVLSSVQEAFGRVLLEAMIAQCPIIATRTNGIPEVVGNAGIIIPPRDTAALAAAMKKIYSLSTESRQHMVENAYAHMLQNYSIPVFKEHFWNLPLLKHLAPIDMEKN